MPRLVSMPKGPLPRGDSFPRQVEPMLATLSCLPRDQRNYAFEYKWDGVRAVCFFDGQSVRLQSRNLLDITPNYSELHELAGALGSKRRVVLDGEIVAFDEAGRPSFARLQKRMHVRTPSSSLVKNVPAYYLIFDLLHLDGRNIMPLPWRSRRELLEKVVEHGRSWRLSMVAEGRGAGTRLHESAAEHELEGIVAKQVDSPYLPGKRAREWLKVKIVQSQELVIGGWTPEKNESERERVGNLLLGYYEDKDGTRRFRYAGGVGTGFNDEWHRELVKRLKALSVDQSPFKERIPKPGTRLFVAPELVAQVEYRRWPKGALIQQASFKGLRTDKKASSVVREDAEMCET